MESTEPVVPTSASFEAVPCSNMQSKTGKARHFTGLHTPGVAMRLAICRVNRRIAKRLQQV